VPLTLEALYEDRGARRLPPDAVRAGTPLPARPDRSMALPLELPRLRLDDDVVKRVAAVSAAPKPVKRPAAPPAARPGASSAAMNEYLRTMENFLKTQQDVMQAALARGGNDHARGAEGNGLTAVSIAPAPPARPAPAFLEAPHRREPDGSLLFRRTLSLDEESFLLEHTLGGRISDDPSLRALPVFPLAMSLEMMAEAAVLALPGRRPIGARSVRVHRWLAFPGPRVSVEVLAAPRADRGPGAGSGGRPDVDEVDVRISELPEGTPGGPAILTVEGTILLGERYPAAKPARADGIGAPRDFRWKPEELYAEGKQHGMFHGPSFRGVASIDRTGDAGAEATLTALPSRGLFRSRPDAAFVLDPLLLDAASQVVGFWTANALDRGFVVFPTGFERLDLHSPPLAAGTLASCRMRGRFAGGDQILADLEVTAQDGRPLLSVAGWEVKRMDLPERFYAYRLSPRDFILSTPLPAPAPARDGVVCCRLDLPERLMEADGRIWREGLAHTVLSRGERQAWRALSGPQARRTEWLLARSAAKDAVRLFLRERRGIAVHAADVEIAGDASGRPVASGGWVERAGGAPAVAMSCSGGVAVAVAGEGRRAGRVGIDAERVGPAGGRPEDGAFSPEERGLLGSMALAERQEWTQRMRCAKEAGARALGGGAAAARGALRALEIDAMRGTVRMGIDGLDASDVTAWTDRDGDLIVATALCQGGE